MREGGWVRKTHIIEMIRRKNNYLLQDYTIYYERGICAWVCMGACLLLIVSSIENSNGILSAQFFQKFQVLILERSLKRRLWNIWWNEQTKENSKKWSKRSLHPWAGWLVRSSLCSWHILHMNLSTSAFEFNAWMEEKNLLKEILLMSELPVQLLII